MRISEGYKRLAWAIGETRAASELGPADTLRAAVIFFNVSIPAFVRHVEEDPGLMPSFTIAAIALNESISRRIKEGSLSYTGYLLSRIHRAHLDERHRIARELHDGLGEWMSGALRQLELHELSERHQWAEPCPHAVRAKDALTEAMDGLRLMITGLRRDPVTNLEKALSEYIASAASDVDVRLRVSGDDSWAPPAVINEVFLIIREALRNALTHAEPQLIVIGVELAPHELRARVEDDGRGFDPRSRKTRPSAGLATMRERAALLGGQLTVASAPGQGTQIEFMVPLLGPAEDPPW